MPIARRGLRDNILPTYIAQTVVTNAQVLAMFTTPVQVVDPIPGNVLWPHLFHVRKATGAYTIGAVTALQLIWGQAVVDVAMNAMTTGFLDQATELTTLGLSKGNGLAADLGKLSVTAESVSGLGLFFRTAAANLTGAGGAMTVTTIYTQVPLNYVF